MDASDCFKKAELIAEGTLSISSELRLPHFLSCSSSGPDAGSYSIVASFGDQRLKIPVSRGSKGRFSMIQEKGQYRILKDGKPYIDDVEILPCSFHAPEQAFIDLNEECIFDCAFCADPRLKPKK
ncbi:MAG: hypothetical protein KAI64_00975, partial [Thermoplasmata archaeon]|nr:hypothetical protein [Thermoplasmata archaeon]